MPVGSPAGINYGGATANVDKVLKGAKPGDLAFIQDAKTEIVVNLKTAAAQGITIPPAVLARATEVIK